MTTRRSRRPPSLPFDITELNRDRTARLVAADWMAENDRPEEEAVLRSPWPQWVATDGRVHVSLAFVYNALVRLQDWMWENTDGPHLRGCGWRTAGFTVYYHLPIASDSPWETTTYEIPEWQFPAAFRDLVRCWLNANHWSLFHGSNYSPELKQLHAALATPPAGFQP